MKILCDRHHLQEVFGVVAAIAPLKTPKAIAKNVLLDAKDGGLTLFATDFEMSARVELDSVKVKEPGRALMPAKETAALLREIADPTVTLETQEFRTTLTSGGGSFVLVGDDPDQFPDQIKLSDGSRIEVATKDFMELYRRTGFAAAKEESRYAINGVLLECRDSSFRMVATDGRRLSLAYKNLDGDLPDAAMIVPLRALVALSRAVPESGTEALEVVFSETQAGFSVSSGESESRTLLVTQLLDSRFPDYEGVIPKMADTTVEVGRSLLDSNVRRVAVLSSGDVRTVRFNFSSSTLELSAESSGVGRGDVVMDVDVKGAGGPISFNPDYVIEALRVSELETIRIDMTDDETPAKFTLGESFTYVLMPISST